MWLAENTKRILCVCSENWTFPEVAILGADRKERGIWGRECMNGLQNSLRIHERSTRIVNAFVCDHKLYAVYRSLVLYLQTLPDITMQPDMSKYKFKNKRVSFHYSDNGTRKDHYHVIQSQAIPRRNIKSTKSGRVSLTLNWKDCGAWIEIKSIE